LIGTPLASPPQRPAFSAPQAALGRRLPSLPTTVICPGFVDTDMAPPFFKLILPAMAAVRCVGGVAYHAAAAVTPVAAEAGREGPRAAFGSLARTLGIARDTTGGVPPARPCHSAPCSGVLEGFNVTGERGAQAAIAAALAPAGSLRPDRKYVMRHGELTEADAGSHHPLPEAEQERMFALCARWLEVWREGLARGGAAAGRG
jgi:hypothetical protein